MCGCCQACVSPAGRGAWRRSGPGGLPAPGTQHLAALHHLRSSAPPPPPGPLGSQGPGPHSAGGASDASGVAGRVTGHGVLSVETEASIRAGGCYMGCEGPELTGLCLLVITFFRKHVYTCGEARVILSILGPLLCRWTLRGGATPRCVLGGPLGPPRDVTGVPNSLLPSVHTSCQPASSSSKSILACPSLGMLTWRPGTLLVGVLFS